MKNHSKHFIFNRNPGWILGFILIFLWKPSVLWSSSVPATASPKVETSSPIHVAPKSVFHESEKDSFSPVGYVKPSLKPGAQVAPKPVVNFKLKINAIMGEQATVNNNQVVEIGGIYQFSEGDKGTVEYKIINITESSVVALYDGKEYEFKIDGSDLELFKEKEETNENTKP